MKLGFLGTGAITSAIVTGLSTQPGAEPILVSPRNAAVAAALAGRFSNVRVAASNQAVLEACDVVVLAFRPQIAGSVCSELHFRPDHHVVSLVATFSVEALRPLVAPAARITRAVPLPSVALRQGPTAIYAPTPPLLALFNSLGVAIELADQAEFDVFTSATAIMASHLVFANTVSSWMKREGVPAEKARSYVGAILQGLAATAAAHPERSFITLADEHQTPGGLNEQVRRLSTRNDSFPELERALDAVLGRIRGKRD